MPSFGFLRFSEHPTILGLQAAELSIRAASIQRKRLTHETLTLPPLTQPLTTHYPTCNPRPYTPLSHPQPPITPPVPPPVLPLNTPSTPPLPHPKPPHFTPPLRSHTRRAVSALSRAQLSQLLLKPAEVLGRLEHLRGVYPANQKHVSPRKIFKMPEYKFEKKFPPRDEAKLSIPRFKPPPPPFFAAKRGGKFR